MFKGNQTHTKMEIVLFMFYKLFTEKTLESNYIKNKFNLSNQSFLRYISTIKNLLAEFGFYVYEITYDRTYKKYRLLEYK
jgi:vesicle coat complex subunit